MLNCGHLDGVRSINHVPVFLPLSIVLMAVVSYANSFPGIFVQDDHIIILGNPMVRELDFSLSRLTTLFRTDYWGVESNSGLFRPLTILSFALNSRFSGQNPFGYHLVNVLLHSGVSLLCWSMLRRWKFSVAVAWFAAALFAVHPLHTEAVNVMVGRSELLVALFLLAAFCVAKGRGPGSVVLTMLFFVMALLSKEHAVTFLVLLPMLDVFCARSFHVWQARWKLYAGVMFTGTLWMIWRTFGVVHTVAPNVPSPDFVPLAYVSWTDRVFAAVELQWLYIAKLFVPIKLQLSYLGESFPKVGVESMGVVLFLALLCVVVACCVGWQKKSALALFVALYFVSFLPTSNLLFPIGVGFAERLVYFPSIWFCAGLSIVVERIGKTKLFRVVWPLGLCFIVAFAVVTVKRNVAFSSEQKVWQAEVATDRSDPVAWLMLGEMYVHNGQMEEAEDAYREMLQVSPDFAWGWSVWGYYLLTAGRYPEAVEAAQYAIDLRQGTNERKDRVDRGVMVESYLNMGNYQEGLFWLEKGVTLPGPPERFHEVHGKLLQGLGRYAEAAEAFQRIPSHLAGPDVPVHLGLCFLQLNRLTDAAEVLEAGQKNMRIDNAKFWNTMGTVRAQQGQWVKAMIAFENALERAPGNKYYKQNLQRSRLEFERSLQ